MSNLWIYTFNKQPLQPLLNEIQQDCTLFIKQWTAHETLLEASFQIQHQRFLIFSVNEKHAMASGCSIDKLTRFIKTLETKHQIDLLNRQLIAIKPNDDIVVYPLTTVVEKIKSKDITANTLMFDNTISQVEDLQNNWLKPLADTYLNGICDNYFLGFLNLTNVAICLPILHLIFGLM